MSAGAGLAFRAGCPDIDAGGIAFTVLSYLSIGEAEPQRAPPSSDGFLLDIPTRLDCAAGCLAVGIGGEGGEIVASLAAAPWFSHLRRAAHGPLRGIGRETEGVLSEVLGSMRGPHVVSVALPKRPSQAEVDVACSVGRAVRRRGAFTVATVSQPSQTVMFGIGGTFDCLIEGDGGLHHHWYPARTVTEPKGGRLVCYDLYDVCSLWAGRVGSFGSVIPNANALHVEVSAEVEALAEVDRLASGMAAGVEDPELLCLFNVVAGVRSDATAVSFSDNLAIRQERVTSRYHGNQW